MKRTTTTTEWTCDRCKGPMNTRNYSIRTTNLPEVSR